MSGGIFGIWQWVVVGLIVVLLFARPGKISGLMGDFGKGLSNFKKGMKDEGNEKQNIEEDVSDNTDKNKS
ncbi:MAG: twin-arginine translocase TatA/TatE family subunit [SAR116 cluster bacterium]|jgi:sec-independent protein translocase protein TatA|nr:twin-arginine translocase TatA/TatE family subunit [SAR116 cluster bacterium]|tara:strand:+ start:260 stop:469 length:210 start_codon:yes stop_codon:yes gene_type:complete